MGQALRRATGKIGTSTTSSPLKKPLQVQPKPPPPPPESIPKPDGQVILEEKDTQYSAMLSQMVGRIQTTPGGKPEMGEAAAVEKYNRPLPKIRNTTSESSRYEGRPAPAGTLNVKQLRHIMMLYQGKADDHDGPMDIDQIAAKFRIDASQVQKIVQYVSLMPEDSTSKKNDPRQ